MTKSKMKEMCNECKENNNGWCKELETNNMDIKMSNCMYNTKYQTEEQTGNITIEQLTDSLLSSDYFVYKLVEELKKRGELK